MLQCVVVCRSVVQGVAEWYSVLQCVADDATHPYLRSVLQCVAVCPGVAWCGAVWYNVLQFGAVCCSVLQCVAVWCR